jgi:hypothetical protein
MGGGDFLMSIEDLGLRTETATNREPRSKHRIVIAVGATALAGAALLFGGTKATELYNSTEYAVDECSDATHIQIDETAFWSKSNFARMLHGDFPLSRPHNYQQLAAVLTEELGYTVTPGQILSNNENRKKAENENSLYPTTASDRFESPAVYCINFNGPNIARNEGIDAIKTDIVFVAGTPPSINDLGELQDDIFKGDDQERVRLAALNNANIAITMEDDKQTPNYTGNVTIYDSGRVERFILSQPGIVNQNEALQRFKQSEAEMFDAKN